MFPSLSRQLTPLHSCTAAAFVAARCFMEDSKGTPGGPSTVEFRAPRFTLENDTPQFLKYLEEHGYAVVASVAKEEDIQKARSLLWDFLETAPPGTHVQRENVKSWGDRRYWLADPFNGIVRDFGFAQSDFMWHLRQLPLVKESFAAIWGTDDLLVSFDGGNIFRPWKYNPGWLTRGGWFHCDQNAHLGAESQGRVCVQGLVTLLDADRYSGGLVVVPGSHRKHEELCQRRRLAHGSYGQVHCNTPALPSALEEFAANPKARFVVASLAMPDMPLKDPASLSQEQRWLIGYDRERERRSYCCVQ
eukprot:Skav223792  [mRNA]  locus=scaffold575:461177:469481:+ [translate_table: standard]